MGLVSFCETNKRKDWSIDVYEKRQKLIDVILGVLQENPHAGLKVIQSLLKKKGFELAIQISRGNSKNQAFSVHHRVENSLGKLTVHQSEILRKPSLPSTSRRRS